MATLRLFAGLREIAGEARLDVPGSTVAEILAAAEAKLGPEFTRGLSRARVWVNGEEADLSMHVGDDDEIALIPPVSGGSTRHASDTGGLGSLAGLAAAAALLVANSAHSQAIWATVVVALAAVWILDVAGTASGWARDIPPGPLLVSVLGSVVCVHLLGGIGFGLALVVAAVTTLAWGVASDSIRILPVLAPAMVASTVASLAVASLMLSRVEFVPGRRAVGVFLAVVVFASLAGAVVEHLAHLPLGEPFAVVALAAVLGSVGAAAFWDLDVVAFFVSGIVLATALVAGHGFGSMLRTGRLSPLDRSPGLVPTMDGPILAAALFYPLLRLLL